MGTIAAVLNGVLQPLFGQLFGEIAEKLSPLTTPDEFFEAAGKLCGYFLLVGFISFILSCCMLYCWINAGEKQAINIRLSYFKSLIQQDIGYFDTINANELSTKVASDCYKIQCAIGEKLCLNLYTLSMLIGSLIIAFMRGWQIALVSLIIVPILWYSCKFLTWVSNGVIRKTTNVYQEAGGLAEQALSSIRTVKGLNGEEYESQKYSQLVSKAFKISLKYSVFTGVAYGVQNMMFFLDFSLTFWIGSIFIEDELMNQNMGRMYAFSDIIVVFLSILLTSFRLGGSTDAMRYFEEAQIAGYDIFKLLEQAPKICDNPKGLQIRDKVKNCQITFENVSFAYPNRQNLNIFNNLNFSLQLNKKTAFVGFSGSGKSTIIQLIERFYDPNSGRILLDNIDIKEFQLNSMRQAIGYVSQEPVLFGTTIRENLRYAKPDATESEMIEALKKANVWSFIEKQEKKLDTFVGHNGTQLSGGQKQRICIARAILKKPIILLLDEATSALDNKNEAQVQKTLDEVAQGITTIIVAHRLSTIQSADEIIVIDQGKVVERGSHEELMNKQDRYFEFVKKQEEINQKNLEKQRNLELKNKEQNEKDEEDINLFLNLDKQNSIPTTNIFTVQTLQTQNQLDNPILQQIPSSKQMMTMQTENILIEKTELNEFMPEANPSSFKSKNETEIKQKGIPFGQMVKKLLSYNKSQRINAFLGILFSLGNGVSYPLCGWVFGNIASVLLDPNVENFREKSNQYSLYFALIGIGCLLSLTFQYFFQSKISENLTLSIRCDLFKKYLKMPLKWFDNPANHSAALSQTLSIDCSAINVLVGTTLTFNFANIGCLLCSILCGLAADWRTTLVGFSLMPLIILSNILFAVRMNIFSSKMNKSSEDTAKLINESSCNIRTVASLGNPQCLVNNFESILSENIAHINKSAFQAGLAIGFTNLSLFGVYGLVFVSGAAFRRAYGVDIKDILISILCLMFGALGIGKNTEYMGDAGAAMVHANKIFRTLDSQDEEQINQGKINLESTNGEITFENVSFKYPQRDVYVLKNVSFKIPARSKVAFVGSSGSGKSSIIQLIQRFYNNYSGTIYLDGVDLQSYNLKQYRNSLGVVSQEPVLFNGSIHQNIVYNTSNAVEKDISDAAKNANALSFIESSSEGFQKQVGLKGNQLSGGQKQRIAISRMILKKPKIMLLDEATSALDSQNEDIVQQSLDSEMEGKTSITVAHRISTIKNSDIIYVLENGQIVEQGNYEQLMELQNHFYKLQQKVNDEQ